MESGSLRRADATRFRQERGGALRAFGVRERERAATALALLAVLRLALHAVAWPAWEGPDEPFHQARAEAWSARPADPTETEAVVPAAFVAEVTARPCGPDMVRALGCAPFDGSGALFNVFRPVPPRRSASPAVNYEAHQPPLWYVVAGVLVLPAKAAGADAEARLLLTAAGVRPRRRLGPPGSAAPDLGVGGARLSWRPCRSLLLLPGGAESLARASNDALVFLLSALVIDRLDRDDPGLPLPALLAAGTLTKLTFLPVVVLCRCRTLEEGGEAPRGPRGTGRFDRRPCAGAAWMGRGGTYELNRTVGGVDESVSEAITGLARSVLHFRQDDLLDRGLELFPRAPLPRGGLPRPARVRGSPRCVARSGADAAPVPRAWPCPWPWQVSSSSRWETGASSERGAVSGAGTRGTGCRGSRSHPTTSSSIDSRRARPLLLAALVVVRPDLECRFRGPGFPALAGLNG